MKAITTWFFLDGGYGGDVRVEGEYRGLTRLSLISCTGPSSYKRTIMSVSYHMKLFNKFITTIRLIGLKKQPLALLMTFEEYNGKFAIGLVFSRQTLDF